MRTQRPATHKSIRALSSGQTSVRRLLRGAPSFELLERTHGRLQGVARCAERVRTCPPRRLELLRLAFRVAHPTLELAHTRLRLTQLLLCLTCGLRFLRGRRAWG